MEKRKVETSQDEYGALTSTVPQERYCRGCVLNVACNVILKDGESCGDRAEGLSDLSYDEWEAMGDNVLGRVDRCEVVPGPAKREGELFIGLTYYQEREWINAIKKHGPGIMDKSLLSPGQKDRLLGAAE
jgi:hypothetical protein